MTKEFAIAAGDQGATSGDEFDRFGAQRRTVPIGLFGHAPGTVQGFRDLAIGGAVRASVGGAQFARNAPASELCQARVGRREALQSFLETEDGVNTVASVRAERNQRRKRQLRGRARKQEERYLGLTGPMPGEPALTAIADIGKRQ
ncbi:hypothetical protein SAMN04487976_11733 [Xaviernesmea oryzae]|nr:hypothetical protein SAMN04487976_11733 [Xaviernesmea oryzae]